MDAEVMEFHMKKWIPIFEEQARSGIGKEDWCDANSISRHAFFKWQREIRKYMLNNNLKMPNIANEYFQSEPGFVDITPKAIAPSVVRSEPERTPRSCGSQTTSGLNIRYDKFVIELNEDTDERLLSMALQVISNVK